MAKYVVVINERLVFTEIQPNLPLFTVGRHANYLINAVNISIFSVLTFQLILIQKLFKSK